MIKRSADLLTFQVKTMEYDKLSFFACHDPETKANKSKIARVATGIYCVTNTVNQNSERKLYKKTLLLSASPRLTMLDRIQWKTSESKPETESTTNHYHTVLVFD